MKIILDVAVVQKGTAGANDKVDPGKIVIGETTKEQEIQIEVGSTISGKPGFDIRVDPWELLAAIRALGYVMTEM